MKEYWNQQKIKINEWVLNRTNIYIKDNLPDHISLSTVISSVEKIIPCQFTKNIDDIFIGFFKDFKERNITSFYSDSAIYISNDQSSDQELIRNIIHEISHSVEENYQQQIYFDGLLEKEFISKRIKLQKILEQYTYILNNTQLYVEPEYSLEFDNFLYKKIGYPKLTTLSSGLFISPYSITSLREYFAIGFENYYLNSQNVHIMKNICPVLFTILENLSNNE